MQAIHPRRVSWLMFCALLLGICIWSGARSNVASRPLPEGFYHNAPAKAPGGGSILSTPHGVLLINLDRRADRLLHFQHNYSLTDMARRIPLHRISAVDGRTVDAAKLLSTQALSEMQDFLLTKVRRKHSQLTPGAIGCYMSHIKCWEYVSQQNRPWIVCEDDAILPHDFAHHVQEALAKIPATQPETVIFFHVICDPQVQRDLRCDHLHDNVYRPQYFWSTACYYITPQAARALLSKALPMSIQVDHAMAQWGRDQVVHNYAYPVVRTWDRGDTDIQAPMVSTIGS